MKNTADEYGDPAINEYVCRMCGLSWRNVKRYDRHRREDH